jgi:protein-S-isoprenylcysteine O-methyltransferase Ste14
MIVRTLFLLALLTGYAYLLLILWSILIPKRRVWPPGETVWKLYLTWIIFYLEAGLAAALIVLDWDSGSIPIEVRFGVGAPLATLGLGLTMWGIRTLGLYNTHGLHGELIVQGPYHFTRNPQYLGDVILLVGIMLMVNSVMVAVINLLIILIFIFMPFSEELWLKEQYKDAYLSYMMQTPRFL